jgi:DNA polymerase-3 subunit delta'
MTSNHLQWIMPTLRSRVQVFDIVLEHEQKEDYLAKKYQLSYKDVEKALQVSRNELAVVDRIKTDNDFWRLRKALIQVLTGELSPLGLSIDLSADYKDVLYWLTSFVIDAYYLKLGIPSLAHQDQELFIQNFSRRYNHLEIYQYYQRLLKLKAYEGKHFNVNKQLAVESLLVELCV